MPSQLDSLATAMAASAEASAVQQVEQAKVWKDTFPDEQIFDWFADPDKAGSIAETDLDTFIAQRKTAGTLTALETEIDVQLATMRGKDAKNRLDADIRIQALIRYLNARNTVVKTSQQELRKFRMKQQEAAPMVNNIYDLGKQKAGALAESFMDADFKDKAVILAGLYCSYLAISGIWSRTLGGKKDDKQPHLLKDILGVGVGGFTIYLAAETMNRAYHATQGKPLVNTKWLPGWGVFPDATEDETLKKNLMAAEVEAALVQLKSANFPPDIFPDYTDKASREKYVRAIGNIGTLSLEQFIDLYKKNFATKSLPSESPYPSRPFRDDTLTNAERFTLLERIGKTLNIIKDTDTGELVTIPNWEDVKDMSIIHRSLDIVI